MIKGLSKTPSLKLSTAQLLPIVTVLVIVLSSIFYVTPTFAKYQANKKAITTEKEDLKRIQAKLTALKALDENELRSELSELRTALPEQKNVPGLIAGISRLAQENNLSVSTLQLRPGKLATESASQEIGVKLVVSGDLRNVDAFLMRLQQIRRIIGVQKFSGSNAAIDGGFVTSMDLVFYTLPLPNQLGSFADDLPNLDKTKHDLISKIAGFPIYTEGTSGPAISVPTPPQQQATPAASIAASASPSARPAATVRPTIRPVQAATGSAAAVSP